MGQNVTAENLAEFKGLFDLLELTDGKYVVKADKYAEFYERLPLENIAAFYITVNSDGLLSGSGMREMGFFGFEGTTTVTITYGDATVTFPEYTDVEWTPPQPGEK